jgi:hypothetical protein
MFHTTLLFLISQAHFLELNAFDTLDVRLEICLLFSSAMADDHAVIRQDRKSAAADAAAAAGFFMVSYYGLWQRL